MRVRLSAVFLTALAMAFGLLTLAGLVVQGDLGALSQAVNQSGIRPLVTLLLRFVVVISAVALMAGVYNLVAVHVRRLSVRRGLAPYSLVMLVSFGAVIVLSVRPRSDEARMVLEEVQIALELAFAGLVLFSLVYGAATLISRRPTWSSALFIVATVVMLLASVVIAPSSPLLAVVDWVNAVPVDAGTRAILLGVALATLVAGIRVLVGQDRATRE
ncbi:MAG: hypothetical protein MUF38_08315 [Anaerolineae bacterium]|nr:hypothetical protein [Anaerolineae bacterium]